MIHRIVIFLCALIVFSADLQSQFVPEFLWHSPSCGYQSRFCGTNKSLILTAAWKNATVWDAGTGQLIRNLVDEAGNLYNVLCTDTETDLAVIAPKKGNSFVMDLRTGKRFPFLFSYDVSLNYNSTEYISFTVINSAKKEIMVNYNGRVDIWNYENGVLVHRIQPLVNVATMVLNKQGTHAIIVNTDQKTLTTLWDVRNFTKVGEFDFPLGSPVVTKFSDNGALFLLKTSDNNLVVRKTETGQIVNVFSTDYTIQSATFFHSSTQLATVGINNSSLKIWDIPTGKLVRNISSSGYDIQISSDDKYAFTIGLIGSGTYIQGSRLTFTEIETGKRTTEEIYGDYMYDVYSNGGSFNEKLNTVIISNQQAVKHIDLAKQKVIVTIHKPLIKDYIKQTIIRTGKGSIAIANADSSVFLLNNDNGTVTTSLSGNKGITQDLSYNADGNVLLTTNSDKIARLWNVSSGELLLTIDGYEKGVLKAQWGKNYNRVLTIDADTAVRVWNSSDGELLTVLKRSGDDKKVINSILQSNNESFILTVGKSDIDIWNANNGFYIQTVKPEGSLQKVLSSENTSTFYTLSYIGNNTTLFTEWDSQTGTLLKKTTLDAKYTNIAINKSEDRILMEREGGYLYLMSLPTLETLVITQGTLMADKSYFDKTGNWFVALSEYGTASVHDGKSGELINTISNETVLFSVVNDNENNITTVNNNGDLKKWKIGKRVVADAEIHDNQNNSEKNTVHTLIIFPNPAKDMLRIYSSMVEEGTMYSVTNIFGENVLKGIVPNPGNECEIEISTLPTGRYIFSVETNGKRHSKEFIVVR